MPEGNVFEWEGGQTHLLELINHELTDSSGSQASHQNIIVMIKWDLNLAEQQCLTHFC